MANRDSAFLWETEVLRSARRQPASPGTAADLIDDAYDWLTIREASEATGVPTSTIRKWARHDNVPSHLEKTEDGYVRIVSMSGLEGWACEIGRDLDVGVEGEEPAGADDEIDLTAPANEPEAPEGTMIVPLDAWHKMLNQLGNLHEAGQQLAEARERAAKAETEARFLRERLRELREENERDTSARSADVEPPREGTILSTQSLIRRIYSDWRRNRRQ